MKSTTQSEDEKVARAIRELARWLAYISEDEEVKAYATMIDETTTEILKITQKEPTK